MNEKLRQTKSMPVSLLIDGRPCLVVGGGKIAARKAGHLLNAGAIVTVVSPKLSDEFAEHDVRHVAREFSADDVVGHTVAFSATNDRHVNRLVLAACREHNVLCSCADGNWSQSDFTTPAIARHGDLTLAVSSGGQSCRRSKMVKNSLAKHLQMMDSAELVVVGTDHHHLNINEREPFHLTGHRYAQTGFMVMQLWGVHEFMILNTCNRVEIMAMVSKETAENGILRHILGFARLNENQFYLKRGEEAFEHIGLVTSGMLSQTPGESHISAQIKVALAQSQEAGWAGSMMQEWVSCFLHISKHIQTEVAPLVHRGEIEDLSLKYMESQHADLSEKTVLMLGAGMIGRGFVRDAISKVGKIIWCYHKNVPELAEEWDSVELCTFNAIKDRIGEADIILSATEAPGFVLHGGHAPFFDQEKCITLIDLGMPRNIDPKLVDLFADLNLVDLDGLKQWYQHSTGKQDELLTKSRQLISEHLEQYERISKSFQSRDA